MERASRVRVSGPLAPYAPGLVGHLHERGYADQGAADYVWHLAQVSRWLEVEGLGADALGEAVVERAVESLHRAGTAKRLTVRRFAVVLGFLRGCGAVPAVPPARPTPLAELLEDYRHYLVAERSLAPLTVRSYLEAATWFLTESCGGDPSRLPALSVSEVAGFVVTVAGVRSPASVNTVVVGVRSLLRWLHQVGLVATPLAQATPWLARGRTATLPRSVSPGTAAALLATCDRATLAGARDFAVLTVLVRLGLRAGEVAAMQLDDLDWRRGELVVHGKGGALDTLPLPVDVGQALVAYLAVRPGQVGGRHLFLRVNAPLGPMTMTNVRRVVRDACRRAGMADTGTHRLRHGVARDLLGGGAPLPEIGQVLRHQDLETTAIYARVDLAALAGVARPWPGAGR